MGVVTIRTCDTVGAACPMHLEDPMTQMCSMITVALALIASVAGCATAGPVPAARIGSAEAAVREARGTGAERPREATIHLRLAEDQIARARRAIEEGELEHAEWLLVRAEADAELASALSREADTKQSADRVATSVREAAAAAGAAALSGGATR